MLSVCFHSYIAVQLLWYLFIFLPNCAALHKKSHSLSHVALPFCFLPWNTKGVIILQPFSHKWMRTKWEKWFKKGLFFRFPDIMIVFRSLILNHSWCNRRVAIKIVHNLFLQPSFCSANSTSGLCDLSRLVLAIL